MSTHNLPGFHNLKVVDNVVSGINSAPLSMFLNIDKPMLIFAFILLFPNMLAQSKSAHVKKVLTGSVLGLVSLPWLGYFLGVIKPELSIPPWIGWFVLNNLLITCVSEEVFFGVTYNGYWLGMERLRR